MTTVRNSAFRRILLISLLPAAVSLLALGFYLGGMGAATAQARLRILEAFALAATAALLIAFLRARSLTRRIESLRRFAEGLAVEEPHRTILPESGDELDVLASSLNRAASRLRALIDRLSLESARREAVLQAMGEGVVAVDGKLRTRFANESFARLLGLPAPPAEGVPLLETVRDSDLQGVLKRVLISGKPVNDRLQLPNAQGRVFEVHVTSLTGTGRPGALAILHDVSDIERLERIRRDFVANVSHELRTPLTAIQGYAETLLDGALEDDAHNRKFVEIIRAHAVRLDSIASDLLVLSELESGRSGPTERVLVPQALEAVLSAVEPEAEERQVRLVRGPMETVHVLGDPLRLEQALLNLVSNAVKFNRASGEVRVAVERAPDSKVAVTVADTGIGIPSQDLPRVFERFYRVDKTRSREVGGTGLGLSIVKHVIERMNGVVQVESRLGSGSTFRVILPLADSMST